MVGRCDRRPSLMRGYAIMSPKALLPTELTEIQKILTQGLSTMTYNMVSQYLVPRGYGWAQATGIARQLVPEFSGVDFAEQWYRPYMINRQHVEAERRGYDELIPRKDIIEQEFYTPARYRYDVSFDVLDDEGNVIDKKNASYFSDEALTPEDIEYRAEQVFTEVTESVPLGAANFRFETMYHYKGWDW